ncbi:hypothetical protein ABT337_09130 [Saccharopolyspora hirsuta]|uniref:hypothetical protein n=1 Tax=Saccharopolyspora hirsuta TaxID=1837 RepID=UPI001BA7D515|nr:hypothetical protein [Saccharopolyspora hirsuta]
MFSISPGDDGAVLRPLEPWRAAEFLAHVDRGREFIGLADAVPTGPQPTPGGSAGSGDDELVGGVDVARGNAEAGCWLEPSART